MTAAREPSVAAAMLVASSLALFHSPARAASEQVPVGPRAIAMGGAFSAIADDASAMFWNPAGLTQLESQELAASLVRLYGTALEDRRLAFALPVARRHVFGLEWYRSGFQDDELDFAGCGLFGKRNFKRGEFGRGCGG